MRSMSAVVRENTAGTEEMSAQSGEVSLAIQNIRRWRTSRAQVQSRSLPALNDERPGSKMTAQVDELVMTAEACSSWCRVSSATAA